MMHPYGRFSIQINTSVARYEGGCVFPQAVRVSSSLFPDTPRVDNDHGYWRYTQSSGIITASQLALRNVSVLDSKFLPPRMPHSAMPLHGWVEDTAEEIAGLEAYFNGEEPTFNGGLALSFHGLQLARVERLAIDYGNEQRAPRHEAATLLGLCLKNVVEIHEARYMADLPSSFVPESCLLAA